MAARQTYRVRTRSEAAVSVPGHQRGRPGRCEARIRGPRFGSADARAPQVVYRRVDVSWKLLSGLSEPSQLVYQRARRGVFTKLLARTDAGQWPRNPHHVDPISCVTII